MARYAGLLLAPAEGFGLRPSAEGKINLNLGHLKKKLYLFSDNVKHFCLVFSCLLNKSFTNLFFYFILLVV